jgi:hypothetical protein
MSALTAVAMLALIGWLVGLQAVRVEYQEHVRLSRGLLVTTTVLCALTALLVLPELYALVT